MPMPQLYSDEADGVYANLSIVLICVRSLAPPPREREIERESDGEREGVREKISKAMPRSSVDAAGANGLHDPARAMPELHQSFCCHQASTILFG